MWKVGRLVGFVGVVAAMLADFRRCCCGLATSVATECRYGCKFLEISGVFYKLIGTCRGIRDRSSAGSRAARSSAG